MDRLLRWLAPLSILAAGGCFLPHPGPDRSSSEEPPAIVVSVSETPAAVPAPAPAAGVPGAMSADVQAAAAAKESAAIAAVMQQVVRSKTDYRLAAADLVSVTVYQDPDMNRKVRVNTNGTVSLPLIGAIKIGGLTLIDAQAAIEAKLAKYLVGPQVSLFVEEYGNKSIFVMGEVQKPGSYPIPTESRMTVLEAISTAGGFTPVAAQDRARVLRMVNGASVSYTVNIKEITQQGQKDKDMTLEPNDIVYVPQSFF